MTKSSVVASPKMCINIHNHIKAKIDSAASDHYFSEKCKNCLTDIISSPTPPVILISKQTIVGTYKGTLPLLSCLPDQA